MTFEFLLTSNFCYINFIKPQCIRADQRLVCCWRCGDEGTQRSRWCQSVISRPSGTVTDACNVGLYEDQYSGHGLKHGLVLSETRWLRVVYSRLKKYARPYKGHLKTTVGQTMVDGYITASLYVGTTDVVKDYAGGSSML